MPSEVVWSQPKSWPSVESGSVVMVRFAHRDALLNPKMADVAVWRKGTVQNKGKGSVTVRMADTGALLDVRDLKALQIEETETTQQKSNKVRKEEPSLIRKWGVG